MIKKQFQKFLDVIYEERKFICLLLIIYIIFMFPVNYYITIGGGTGNIDERIKVENEYKSSGSFNIAYVSELKGRLGLYLLSYVIPNWTRESYDDYKYTTEEDAEDISFRSKKDLEYSNSQAMKWAYELSENEVVKEESNFYIIAKEEYDDLKLKIQDQIISVDDKKFDDLSEYREYINSLKENDIVSVKVKRNNKNKTVKAKVHKYEDRLILGVGIIQIDEYKTKPKATIKFKSDESGPSGGLITTLSLYDKLTKEDLTKGYKIVGTGTIESDGTIGPIGGVKYKLLGAVADKADIFLVPSGENYKTCKKLQKEQKLDIKIIEVKTIEDAIQKLKEL